MHKYIKINGGNELSGTLRISGAKNSVLALMIASTLTNEVINLEDVPEIKDVKDLITILKKLNSNVILANKCLAIDNEKLEYRDLLIDEVTSFRASYYFMGAFISRFKKCKLYLPGGCYLGPRPIDLHIMGFKKLGCDIKIIENDQKTIVDITCPNGLIGNEIFLDFPSVGATINLMLAAVMAEGETKIENAAKEPEIVDVATLLNNMGAKITGAGTDEIRIVGVEKLNGTLHQVVPDRIEAGTYLMISVLLGNDIYLENIIPDHLEALCSKLKEIGFQFEIMEESIYIPKNNLENLKGIDIRTGVFPSFPTDLQQIFLTLTTQLNGTSNILETIYPERFKQCKYLQDMGANINLELGEITSKAEIKGKTTLIGKTTKATDLRAGASLILAGLLAQGETKIYNIEHILRGYDNLIEKLTNIGAKIYLCEENDE